MRREKEPSPIPGSRSLFRLAPIMDEQIRVLALVGVKVFPEEALEDGVGLGAERVSASRL
jgi:hypothetical protein